MLAELAASAIDVPIVLIGFPVDGDWEFSGNAHAERCQTDRLIDAIASTPVAGGHTWSAASPREDGVAWWFVTRDLSGTDGSLLGKLVIADHTARQSSQRDVAVIEQVAVMATIALERGRREHDSGHRHARCLIIDEMGEGVILHDPDGVICEWNRAAEQLLGVSTDELRGSRTTDERFRAFRPDGSALADDERPSSIARLTGERVDGAVVGLARPDGFLWLRVSAQPVVDDDGRIHVISTFADVTTEVEERAEKCRLEAALSLNDRFAHACIDALDQGVMLTDGSGMISLINPAAERILGYSAAEITNLWHLEDWPSFDEHGRPLEFMDRPIVRALVSGEAVRGVIISWRRGDGRSALLRMSCVPDADSAGAMMIVLADVTEERRAQQLLDAMLDVAPAGLTILDASGVVTRSNPAFARQAGIDEADLVGVDVFELIHPDDRVMGLEQRARLAAGEVSRAALDHRVVRPDGAEVWLHTQIATVPHTDPPISIAATFDVTERRQLLRELSRFSYLVDYSNDMITLVDERGEIKFASPATGRLLGFPDGYRDPDGIFGMIHPDDVPGASAALERLRSSSDPAPPFTARVRTQDARWLHMEFSCANLLDEPAVAGLLVIGRDVTQRVELTAELEHRALHDTLTGLPNRHQLHRSLERALSRSETAAEGIGLCFIDLDGFKGVNDAHGHAAGDAVLISVADSLRSHLRDGDMAARMGGDEFVVVLDPITSIEQARDLALAMRDALVATLAHDVLDVTVGASVGVAIGRAGDDVWSIVRRADTAMYCAKAGRASKVAFEPIGLVASGT